MSHGIRYHVSMAATMIQCGPAQIAAYTRRWDDCFEHEDGPAVRAALAAKAAADPLFASSVRDCRRYMPDDVLIAAVGV